MDTLCQQDEGYKFMKSVRSSPAYWESKKKDVFAMIRQLGLPTLFMTFSAAESKWTDLLRILKRVVDKEDVTNEYLLKMTYEEKARLIRSDPVTCARFFENKFRNFLHKILLNKHGPFKETPIEDYYIRFEFQHRGSVHAHMVVWLKQAPVFEPGSSSSKAKCIDLIDSLISCNSDENLADVLPYQFHKHSFTCRKSANMKCRFGIPFLPMKHTDILEPLEVSPTVYQKNKQILKKIAKDLDDDLLPEIDSLLELHCLTYEEYVAIIRSQLKRPKVFLRREVKDCRINAYNKTLLRLFEANMDIQFIVDAYACVAYIIDYINKSNRGMSLLMRNLVAQLSQQNLTVKKKLQTIATKFINATEISAQEAAYHILELPLSKGSRQVIYVNTGRPEERVKMVKSKKELLLLDEESRDVFHNNIIDHYCQRPHTLERLCLADFAANFNIVRSLRKRVKESEKEKHLPLLNKSGYVIERKKPKVIRYRRYSIEQEPLEFWRENIMLFRPWRDEHAEILNCDIASLYLSNQLIIEQNRKRFNMAQIADREEEGSIVSESDESQNNEFGAYRKPKDLEATIEIKGTIKSEIPIKRIALAKNEFEVLVKQLNEKQYRYALSVWSRMRSGISVFDFVTGGAGTGKSKLIAALSAAIDRFYNIISVNEESNVLRALICAPTGKAAHNVKGLTLHTAFCLPVSQNKEPFHQLSADKVNTLRCKMHGLKFIIIDEISMVGATLLEQVESRLRQIFNNPKPFGGISIIAVGDFVQLKPVCDSYVFQGSKRNPYHAVAADALWSRFNFYELDEIMRQKGDVPFAKALQNYASCCLTEDDLALLRDRQNREGPPACIHLYSSNCEVDAHNEDALSRLDTFGIESIAHDTCHGQASEHVKEGYLKSLLKAKVTETCGLRTNVSMKLTAKYMITDNIDIEDGLVNGAIGTLVHISLNLSKCQPVVAWLRFDDHGVGTKARAKYKQLDVRADAVPIFKTTKLISNKGFHKQLQIYRSQFPLAPAEAITIHKSQGSTYKHVAYHVGKYVTHSSAYVALSRATSAQGLYIYGDLRIFSQPNSVVTAELQRLRSRPSGLEFSSLLDKPSSCLKITSFNVQSLMPHYEIILKDPCLNNSDILCFVETWTLPTDVIVSDSYRIADRIDCSVQRKPAGIVVLARKEIDCVKVSNNTLAVPNANLQASIVLVRQRIYIIAVYASPKTPRTLLMTFIADCLKSLPTKSEIIVTGDFNVPAKELEHDLHKPLRDYKLHLRSPLEASTYHNTQIDLTFSNMTCECSYYDTFLSYHRPQVLHVFSRPKYRKTKKRSRWLRWSKLMPPRRPCRQRKEAQSFSIVKYSNVKREIVYSYYFHYREYLRSLCRKRNRHKKSCHNISCYSSRAVRAKN